MPCILSHPAVPIALALAAGRARVGTPLLLCGIVASVLPDADVLAFRLGIPYGDAFGHRGASHSLLFALLLGLAAWALAPRLRASRAVAFVFIAMACASHGLLDMLTNGGHGVAFFWPWSDQRHFLPAQVIEVSTLNLRRFFGPAGVAVLLSELRWVWLPALAVGLAGLAARQALSASAWRSESAAGEHIP
jgi:inner membrane protein